MSSRLTIVLMLALAINAFGQNSKIPQDRLFIIQSAMNYGQNDGGCWDIPGGKNPKLKKGKNIEAWELNGGNDQKFKFVKSSMQGYYKICVSYSSKYRVNVDGGKSKNGTNIELWTNNSNKRQNFRLKHLGNGRFKIYTTTGRVVCLNGRKNKNGTNIHIWEDHNGKWMEWYLIDAKTRKKYVPVSYPNSPEFFIKNKDKVFKASSSTLVGSRTAYCKVVNYSNSWVDLYSKSEGFSEAQGKNTINRYISRLYYDRNSGEYNTGNDEYSERGKVSNDKMSLSISGDQSGTTYTLSGESISKVFEPTPVFFEIHKDKLFDYSEYWTTGQNNGTAKVKKVEKNKVTFLTAIFSGDKSETKELVVNYADGRFGVGAYDPYMQPHGYVDWYKKLLELRGEESGYSIKLRK